jgi:hypothetical protein
MPGIEMFDSRVDADFSFRRDRLRTVTVRFDPVRASSEAVVERIDGMLRAAFSAPSREDSADVAGAYRLNYSQTGRPSLWVNLSDPTKPQIILTLVDLAAQAIQDERIQTREQRAFGP